MELTLGVIATSRKADEHRLAIHPRHLSRIDAGLRPRLFLERGYGLDFSLADEELEPLVGGLRTRAELMQECDAVVLPKPLAEDLGELPEGKVLWGWPHCVQDEALTQAAIERRQTLVAWEAMHHWTRGGGFGLHVFHKNNELAGYCSTIHALQLTGRSGAYGRRLRAAVIGFGAAGRGAVTALFALGIHDVDVLTHRSVPAVAAPMAPARLVHYERDPGDPRCTLALHGGDARSVAELLADHDVIVNCVLQDTDDPVIFVAMEELALFRPGTLIVDVSVDAGMGFEWARATSFAAPMFSVGDRVRYYAVDHTPSLLWDSATWEISEALLPFLGAVMAGEAGWDASETIRRAIEIRAGVVQNEKILSFQRRSPTYPHAKL